MRQRSRWPARPSGARASAAMAFAVMAGLLAMHGLGSSAVSADSLAAPIAQAAEPVSHPLDEPPLAASATDRSGTDWAHRGHHGHDRGPEPVRHGGTGQGPGHPEHADDTCAAGATSTSPELPAPAPAAVDWDVDAEATRCLAPTGARSGRAPPSLSALQLLRV